MLSPICQVSTNSYMLVQFLTSQSCTLSAEVQNCQSTQNLILLKIFTKLSTYTKSKSAENVYAVVLPACAQRGGGFTQAGASVRLGREQKMLLPALCQTSLHPRLRETARWAQAFFISSFSLFFRCHIG